MQPAAKRGASQRSLFARIVCGAAMGLAWVVAFSCSVWAFGALWFDLPGMRTTGTLVFAVLLIGTVIFVRGAWRKIGSLMFGFVMVLAWWWTLKPSNVRSWQPDVAEVASADIAGDTVTLHNVRNCEYRTETEFTPRWEERTVRLSKLTAIDIAITYWGSPYMAHPIVSFQFADAPPLCFSIETRKEVGESYSAIGGFYRQYELIYVVADERDVIRLRTNFRKGEDVYLYRLTISAKEATERFLEYLATLNKLRTAPRWYNAATTNCTTSIRTQHNAAKRMPWDWRLLVNGMGDELLFERHAIADGGLPFAELKTQALINKAAQSANTAPDFSARIRAGRVGF